jgi:hypothetical protein
MKCGTCECVRALRVWRPGSAPVLCFVHPAEAPHMPWLPRFFATAPPLTPPVLHLLLRVGTHTQLAAKRCRPRCFSSTTHSWARPTRCVP